MTVLGKNVIENLTIGMYEDSRFIYREYIQNSADQIDKAIKSGLLEKEEAIIDIEINDLKRNIKIYDNATGIKSVKFKDTLSDIANSDKDRNEDKGFRGIGRLGGLAYCDKLIFRSSYIDENIESIMIWDAKLCKEIIEDPNKKCTAEDLINKITTFEEKECELETHFFEVEMINVHKESEKLLDVEDIKNYLSFIAPVPFVNSFRLRTKIYKYVEQNNLMIDEYCIRINGERLFKQYKMDLYKESNSKGKEIYDEIYDIHFHKFIDDNNELLAWMWIGISRFEKQIPKNNLSRGIRLRKGNIGIGGDNTLAQHHLFNENRANYYFIGEVYAIHNELIPNARRDYFNENKYRVEFEELLSKKFKKELESMYKEASEVRSAYRRKSEYKKIKQDFNEKKEKGLFLDENELNKNQLKVEEAEKNAEKSEQEIIKRKYKYDGNKVFQSIFEHIEKKYSVNGNIDEPIKNKINDNNTRKIKQKKKQMFASNIPGYSKKEKKLLERVFKTINNLLPPNEANELISKIKEELMNNE